jgi:hypothetical protein
MFVLADLHAQGSLHRLAYSARPDAPVLPASRRRFARRPTDAPGPSRRPSPSRSRHRPARPAVGCA